MNEITTTDVMNFQSNISEYMSRAARQQGGININTEDGSVVLLSKEMYNSMRETVYLLSVPGMKEQLQEGLNTPIGECDPFEW